MEIVDIIVIAAILAVLGAAVWYVRRSRKKDRKCIGCPDGYACSGKGNCCGGCSGCSGKTGCGHCGSTPKACGKK